MDIDGPQVTSDGGDDSLFWDIFKIVAFVVGVLVLLRVAWAIASALFVPLLIVALAYGAYKIFLDTDDDQQVGAPEDPALIEEDLHSESGDILDDDPLEDPIEKEFEELEQKDSSL